MRKTNQKIFRNQKDTDHGLRSSPIALLLLRQKKKLKNSWLEPMGSRSYPMLIQQTILRRHMRMRESMDGSSVEAQATDPILN
jgi:hypothetical protein